MELLARGRLSSTARTGRKAARLIGGVIRHRAMYPALRARPLAHRLPAEALAELGFDPSAVAALEDDCGRAAADIYPVLAERMARSGAPAELHEKLRNPDAPQNDSNRLVYLTVRLLQPDVVVETGTFAGMLSSFVLRGLEDNGRGRLVSLDLPAYEPIPHAIDFPIPPGEKPGWAIPDRLRGRLELVLGDARQSLPSVLERTGPIGVFVHDSLQTVRHMLFEYRTAWASLLPGGVLFSNNVYVPPAFWWFTQAKRAPFLFVGGDFGVTRKPAA